MKRVRGNMETTFRAVHFSFDGFQLTTKGSIVRSSCPKLFPFFKKSSFFPQEIMELQRKDVQIVREDDIVADEEIPCSSTRRMSALSIVIDDFDLVKAMDSPKEAKMLPETDVEVLSTPPPLKQYTRSSSDASIKKILEEAEHRKDEFRKLIDEHDAVIKNLKRIEKNVPYCNGHPQTIRT